MPVLNTSYGWSAGDQTRLLIAAGLTIGSYQLDKITVAMNTLGDLAGPNAVSSVLDLIDQYETAQIRYNELNSSGDSRILVKADVLEWEAAKGFKYDVITEISRIRGIIQQYFSFSELFIGVTPVTPIIRS